VVEYNFGQVQHTSQVERKTKCSKKTTAGDLAVLWAALFYLKKVTTHFSSIRRNNNTISSVEFI